MRHLAMAAPAIVLVGGGLVGAQRPERQPEVRVPGINISLKAGWQLLFHDGCRFAVPGSWRADGDASLATAPDGSSISISLFTITS
jgi:hypothetical protein